MTQDPVVMDGYVRVSRRLGREGAGYISPTVQREAIQRWADYKGVHIAQWFVDEDQSGGTHDRPGLEQAVARALSGETSGIASWKIDRFSRMTEHGLRDLRRLEEQDARLAFVVEDIDTSGPFGKFVYTIMLAMSELFLDTIKAGWRTAKTRAVERGAHIGPTPFGYARGPDGILTIDEDRGEAVSSAFAAAARENIDAAMTVLKAQAPERTWTTFTVRRLLANRTYLGEVSYGDDLGNTEAHDPLVSPAIFTAAQHEATGQRRAKGDFPLSGIASCGTCGARMVGARGGADARRMYRCADHRSCDRPAVITADLLEAHVVSQLRERFSRDRTGYGAGNPTVNLEGAESALLEAESELDAFAADTTARKLLGHRYHQALQARVSAVDTAREELRSALGASINTTTFTPPWDDLEPAELAEVLRGGLETVIVRRGRGRVADRVVVVVKGEDGDVVPGPEDA